MSNFVNRNDLSFVRSGNDPEFPDPPWLVVAPGSGNDTVINTVPQQYRKIAGDVLSEMTQAEKDAVDAAALDAARDAIAAQFDAQEDTFRAFALALLDELNNHATKINSILDAIDNANNLGDVKTAVGAITDYPQRTVAQMKAAVRGKLGS